MDSPSLGKACSSIQDILRYEPTWPARDEVNHQIVLSYQLSTIYDLEELLFTKVEVLMVLVGADQF